MLTTVHLLAGAAAGKATDNVYAAAILGFASHYLLDIIPHYNPKPVKGYREENRKTDKLDLALKSAEPILGIIMILFFAYKNPVQFEFPIIVGAFFGWLPDLFTFLNWKFGIGAKNRLHRWERRWHWHTDFIKGMAAQIALAMLAIYFLR